MNIGPACHAQRAVGGGSWLPTESDKRVGDDPTERQCMNFDAQQASIGPTQYATSHRDKIRLAALWTPKTPSSRST